MCFGKPENWKDVADWKALREAIMDELIQRYGDWDRSGVLMTEAYANSIAIAALQRVRQKESS